MKFIKQFSEINLSDLSSVGGKNASLGQMFTQLSQKGIDIPEGFAITAQAYWHYLDTNNLRWKIENLLTKFYDYTDLNNLQKISMQIRNLFEQSVIPKDLEDEILVAYKNLCAQYNSKDCAVAVRSSATAEDLPTASFAGQQETFLNVKGEKELIEKYKKCLSSLFTPRAIAYRIENKIDHTKVALSVGVQKMVNAISSGVAFTLDTETGFKDVIFINSSWGLGEAIVQGAVDPDSFYVYKPTLQQGFKPILKKQLGKKEIKTIYSKDKLENISVEKEMQNKFSLTDDEILDLAKKCLIIEEYYSELNNKWTPMDIEWAKDSNSGKIYIIQARYETIHSQEKENNILTNYILKNSNEKVLLTGQSIGTKIVSGNARVILNVKDINEIQNGDILVTTMTDPDWVPAMKKVAGIITDKGGRTCHAAIVSRELGIPAIIGTEYATKFIKTGTPLTLDCSQGETGKIYEGIIPFEIEKIELKNIKKPNIKIFINAAVPEQAFKQSFLPVDGVGLARLEFIISNAIKIHPMALIHFDQIKDLKTKNEIENITTPYNNDKIKFFVDCLAQNAGTIAAAFYPRPVIIRLSDFKSNEYRNLIGGQYFESQEENPMLGIRGASRYYSNLYKDAFALECDAIKKIRNEMGFKNVKIMIPFVRTPQEARKILELMKNFGLEKDKDNLEIIMMCELPSNVILIDEFSKLFNGFSIGSNDLAQTTLGVDRDSAYLAQMFNENNQAVKIMMQMAIEGAKRNNKPIGICGQGPSDYPELAKFLIDCGIDSISLNPDTVLKFLQNFNLS